MGERITLWEVGPRDGLQYLARPLPVSTRIELIDRLSKVGFPIIEAGSFVSARRVPQMAEASAVMAGITRQPGTRFAALTPNLRGYEAARDERVDIVAVFASASEKFSRENINCTMAESLERFAPIMEVARQDGIPVRAYLSCVIACPYEGPIAPEAVADMAEKLLNLGAFEVSLGDTIGAGREDSVAAMLDKVLAVCPAAQLAGHFHDTGGKALANIRISLERGLRVFDASIGGLGGCPFAPGASGNVASEAVVAMLEEGGWETGLDASALADAARFVAEEIVPRGG
ncbi:MAG: hydroxymethylglutaryl-CoA lyase [Pseudomonadota bacterium]